MISSEPSHRPRSHRVDNLQYANWSEKIFRQMREGGVDAVHVTIAYHENFRETVLNIERWNRWFEDFSDVIFHGRTGDDVRRARETDRTAIFFGFQNPSPIEDDIGLVEVLHTLGARFMQLSYNNQSLLATGCYEAEDPGITRMGKQVIKEMNRVGLVVDTRRWRRSIFPKGRSPSPTRIPRFGTRRCATNPMRCSQHLASPAACSVFPSTHITSKTNRTAHCRTSAR